MVDLQSQYKHIKSKVDFDVINVIENASFINGPTVKSFQKNLEDYLNVKHVIPCANGTDALQIAMMGLNLKPGDEVITADFTFAATVEVIALLNLTPVLVDVDLDNFNIDCNMIRKAITSKTKAISFCHVTRGGHLYPVKEIVKMAKNRNLLTLIDGAQAAGQFPINLKEIGCDAYSVSLHKWILAPAGTGFLYINNEAKERVTSPFVHENEPKLSGFNPPGTKDFPVRAAIGTALDYINAIGLLKIEKRCRSLSNYLKAGLSQIDSITILSSPNDHLSAPGSTIFEKKGLDAYESVPMMEKLISTHIDEHVRDGHNAIRVSTHIYNTKQQIDRLLEALS
jgi:selenocysteine lyase/cysteine desulfurase